MSEELASNRQPASAEDREKLLKKIRKHLPIGMEPEIEAMGGEQLKKTIVDREGFIKYALYAMSKDEDLKAAKERVKELAEPYQTDVKAHKAVISLSVLMLEDRGEL